MRRLGIGMLSLLLMAAAAFSQVKMTPNWEIKADAVSWFKADNNTRGLAYNPATDHVLVVARTGAPRVVILNAANGDSLGTLDLTNVGGGTFPINLIDVDENGVIYACNLSVSNTANFKVYRWQSEAAQPTVAFDALFPTTPHRYGDAFGVVGTGANTEIYAAGGGNTLHAGLLTTADGVTYVVNDTIRVGTRARLGIDATAPAGNIWGNAYGVRPALFDQTGTLLGGVAEAVAGFQSCGIKYFKTTPEFIAVNQNISAGLPKWTRLINVTNGPERAFAVGETAMVGTNANLNGTGAFGYDPVRNALIVLLSNNVIGSYSLAEAVTRVPVTFQIDMGIQKQLGFFKPDSQIVVLRGNFINEANPGLEEWKGNRIEAFASAANPDVYTLTVGFPASAAGSEFEFKYVIENLTARGDSATQGGSWENVDNRKFTLAAGGQVLDKVYFNNKTSVSAKVKVTFWVNTATVPDTITSRANIQIRGNEAPLTWDNATGGKLNYVSGDYWTTTLEFESGTELRFKLFADSENDGNSGWEANLGTGSTNREWKVGNADETVPLLFYNTVNGRDQFYTPFTDADKIDVLLRVNVAGYQDWNPATREIGIRGGVAPFDWGTSFKLAPEQDTQNAGQLNYPAANFWSGVAQFPKAAADVPYQFVVLEKGTDNVVLWENQLGGFGGNRQLLLNTATPDTTLYWKWLGDVPPLPTNNKDAITVTFRTDVTKAIRERGFSHGDTLEAVAGYNATANAVGRVRLARQGFTNIYQGQLDLVSTINKDLDYQYYVTKNGVEVRENYYDFNFTGSPASRAERRRLNVPGATFQIDDVEASEVNARRQPTFPNQSRLARNVMVTWEVDLRPAIYQVMAGDTLFDIQGDFNITKATNILAAGVWMNGPAVGGWSNTGGDWGLGLQNNLNKKMYDDGTNGDRVAGDSIFTRMVLASPDSTGIGSKSQVGQVYKFGIQGGDNEGGKGGFGNNHVANIDDSGPTFTIYTQFGSINPAYYDAWDFDNRRPTAVKDRPGQAPLAYVLEQNYPNPFNPETEIRYGIPKNTRVTLSIYNLAGQLVATLFDGAQVAGTHSVRWNGFDRDGQRASSGIYLYKLETPDFVKTNKMVLTK